MDIILQQKHDFTSKELIALFESVQWESAEFPERLLSAIKNYPYVCTARAGERLVGLLAALDDGGLNAYIHYLLVEPAFQKHGIGKELLLQAKEHYKNYYKLFLIADSSAKGFYDGLGFMADKTAVPMFIVNREKNSLGNL